MDEPGYSPRERGEQGNLLPLLLLLLALVWIGALIAVGWHEAYSPRDSDWLLRIHIAWMSLVALAFVLSLVGRGAGSEGGGEPEAWLCQHCLKPYVPGAHFCPRCGAPKTWFSGTGEYERIHNQAWGIGKAVRYPSRLLHVAGLIAFALPGILGGVACVVVLLGPVSWAWHQLASATTLYALDLLIYGPLIVLCLRAWRRRRRGVLPPRPEIEYGCPPWFSYDAEWALPEFEEEPEGGEPEPTPAAG